MTNNLKIDAILFDLDDTIINSKKAQLNAILEFKKKHEEFKNIGDEEFAEKWDAIVKEKYKKYLKEEIKFSELKKERMKAIFLSYGIDILDKEAEEQFDTYQQTYEKNWIMFDDTQEVLDDLKIKYKLAIVSNGDSIQQRKKIKLTGLDRYFTDIFISEEVGYAKPQKEIFLTACKAINVKPENVVMIGDKYKVDIEGSLNAGLNAIWVNRKNEKINYKWQIKELKELKEIL